MVMRREVITGAGWLAGAGVTAAFGYLVASVAASSGRHPFWPYLLFAAVAVSGGILYLLGNRSGRSRGSLSLADAGSSFQPDSPVPIGRITSLRDGSKVDHKQLVSGSVAGAPADAEPWLLVRPYLDGVFYPQQRLFLDMNHRFKAAVYFGRSAYENAGEEFLLLLVLASASEWTRRYMMGVPLKELPESLRILDQRTVTRR